jgi:hypothetical protein
MTLTDFRELVEPIMNDNFNGVYDQRTKEWEPIYTKKQGLDRSSHVQSQIYGFGLAPILADGAPVVYDQGGALPSVFYPYDEYALGFALTERAIEDSDWLDLTEIMSKQLAQSMYESEELAAANILNYGFNSAFTQQGGDGLPLFSDNHPLALGGTYSNVMPSASLSMTSLEDMVIRIRNAVDPRGKRIKLTPEILVVPPALMMQAPVVLKSVLNPDATTASNAINPINSEGFITKGYQVITRLTSNTAWFVSTDLHARGDFGLVRLNRKDLTKRSQADFNTNSIQYIASMRYRFGWLDPRGMWGNAGA